MAIGDAVVVASTSIANNAFLTIQPGVGIEWVIHNVHAPSTAAIELYVTDGSNDILTDKNTGGWLGYYIHVTNAQYIKVKNVSGGIIYMKYDGIITKST